jgi:hypothetical protein
MPSIIKRVTSAITKPVVQKYHEKQKEKADYEQNEKYKEVIEKNAHSQEYWKSYRKGAKERAEKQGYLDATSEPTQQKGKGGVRRGVANTMQQFSVGSAKALESGAFNFGGGSGIFNGLDSVTMGGSAGADTLKNVEYITGVSERKKVIAPQGGQPGRGNIVINVGGSASNRKRKPAAQVPREKDWQDNLSDITGF